eukprot:scaffold9150_cov120-Isochrysis_galbana.AAC.8
MSRGGLKFSSDSIDPPRRKTLQRSARRPIWRHAAPPGFLCHGRVGVRPRHFDACSAPPMYRVPWVIIGARLATAALRATPEEHSCCLAPGPG